MQSVHLNHQLPHAARYSVARWLSPTVIREYLVRLWQSHGERQRLADLEPRLLRDIGVDPIAASYENSAAVLAALGAPRGGVPPLAGQLIAAACSLGVRR